MPGDDLHKYTPTCNDFVHMVQEIIQGKRKKPRLNKLLKLKNVMGMVRGKDKQNHKIKLKTIL